MTRVTLLLVLVGACGFSAGGGGVRADDVGDDTVIDAPTDPDAPDGAPQPVCLGSLPRVCMDTVPANLTITTAILIDTSAPLACATTTMNTADGMCVLAASAITIGPSGSIVATGPKPLVIFAPGGITIGAGAIIDVASHDGQPPGAGAAASISSASNCGGGTAGTASGGGQGGSFGGSGGNGGSGRTGAGAGGQAGGAVTAFTTLRAGCGGAPGSGGPSAGVAGAAGSGGGAVSIVAASITSDGTIRATGAPGKGGLTFASGGGGGGSGGAIVLDSGNIMLGASSVLLAQGAGGGEGCGGDDIHPGMAGSEATAPFASAPGGLGLSASGGDGGSGGSNGGGFSGIAGSNGGGGAGGGTGIIKHTSSATPVGGAVSPPFTSL